MRHILGVEREWLMECRSRIGKATLSMLSGGQLEEEDAPTIEDVLVASLSSSSANGNGNDSVAGKKTSKEALEAARKRYLERKSAAGGAMKK